MNKNVHFLRALVLIFVFASAYVIGQNVTSQVTIFKKEVLSEKVNSQAKSYSLSARLQNKRKEINAGKTDSIVIMGATVKSSSISAKPSTKLPTNSQQNSKVPVEAIQPKSADLD